MTRGRLRALLIRILGLQQRRRRVLWTCDARTAIVQEGRRRNETSANVADLATFERGFSTRSAGCRRVCECGREFYNPGGGWDWEEGELEALAAGTATALDWSVGALYLEGKEYVLDCDCWRPRAARVVAWLRLHDHEVAAFLSEEKRRRELEARNSPTVEEASA